MEKFLEIFQFSTTIPGGYMLFYGIWVIAVICCIISITSATAQRKFFSGRFMVGGFLLVCLIIFLAANFIFSSQLDMNPSFQEKDVVGLWRDDKSNLVLSSDNSAHFDFSDAYKKRIPILAGKGTWRKVDDFEIEIIPDESTQPMQPKLRVIENNRELRIIVEDFEDPDEWDHHLGFKREPTPQVEPSRAE